MEKKRRWRKRKTNRNFPSMPLHPLQLMLARVETGTDEDHRPIGRALRLVQELSSFGEEVGVLWVNPGVKVGFGLVRGEVNILAGYGKRGEGEG
jgi:hypothetical protein